VNALGDVSNGIGRAGEACSLIMTGDLSFMSGPNPEVLAAISHLSIQIDERTAEIKDARAAGTEVGIEASCIDQHGAAATTSRNADDLLQKIGDNTDIDEGEAIVAIRKNSNRATGRRSRTNEQRRHRPPVAAARHLGRFRPRSGWQRLRPDRP
jgi:hypothetical protein